MVSLLEIFFASIFLLWVGRLVYRQNWQPAYMAAAYLVIALLVLAMWNRPFAGQWGMVNYGPFIVVLATIGVAIVGKWAYRRWDTATDHRPGIAIVVVSILLLIVFWWPFFVAGPASITPSIPTAPAPVASAPTLAPAPAAPAAATPSSAPRRARASRSSDGSEELSPRAKQALENATP